MVKKCLIETDVVESDIPMLMSRSAMKKAGMKLDLLNDKAEIFGKEVDLQSTSSGHYVISLKDSEANIEQSLFAEGIEFKEKEKIVTKLHKQFAHPSKKRLKSLLVDAGIYDKECEEILKKLSANCHICLEFSKTPARPVVSLPLATKFNQVVVMDLKEKTKNKVWYLHLIDAATRLTISSVIYNKLPATIIEKVMLMWIGAGFGAPGKFLADNGGEFANEQYRDMCENLNIECCKTAAYSPWQNGLCERNHAVVDECIEKILSDNPKLSRELAVVWANNAKNCLQMNSGYSSYQLVYGQNPNLPNVLNDDPPALFGTTVSDIFAKHLNALHSARQSFIKAESSERIRRALRHQIRVKAQVFDSGDKVYYKREGQPKWHGPGTVIGQDGKTIFVRHGSIYVRVASCRMIKAGTEFNTESLSSESDSEPLNTKQKDIVSSSANENESSDEDRDTSSSFSPDSSTILNDQALNTDSVSSTLDIAQSSIFSHRCATDNIPNVGTLIKYKTVNDEQWQIAKVLSRAGKKGGKYSNWLNIQNVDKEPTSIDFENDVVEWTLENDNTYTDGSQNDEVLIATNEIPPADVMNAKASELNKWKLFNVYEEVKNDGQPTMSTRWVVTKKELETKARLVIRGFEEDLLQPTDSPTAAKDTIRVFLSVCASIGWSVKSIDIKSAFLQGENITRDIFIYPPSEAKVTLGHIWKLHKVVYGLNDASRNWYFSVRK